MAERAFVIVSGLPASGKTTLAHALANALNLPVLDKDAILETLYDTPGPGDHHWRHRLSRAADEVLFTLAAATPQAVLDNWWHHETAPARLRQLGALLIEVFCDCDPALAARRFQQRTRHPGHLDPTLTDGQVEDRVAAIRATYPGPLRLGGPLITIDNSTPVDTSALARQITTLLPGRPPSPCTSAS